MNDRDGVEVTDVTRTLVSGCVPLACAVKVSWPVSQLSRKTSASPPTMSKSTVSSKRRLAPLTGTTDVQALIWPKHAVFAPTGSTL